LNEDAIVKCSVIQMNIRSLIQFSFFPSFLLPLITTEAQHLSKIIGDTNILFPFKQEYPKIKPLINQILHFKGAYL
jgi:hypothetical protein